MKRIGLLIVLFVGITFSIGAGILGLASEIKKNRSDLSQDRTPVEKEKEDSPKYREDVMQRLRETYPYLTEEEYLKCAIEIEELRAKEIEIARIENPGMPEEYYQSIKVMWECTIPRVLEKQFLAMANAEVVKDENTKVSNIPLGTFDEMIFPDEINGIIGIGMGGDFCYDEGQNDSERFDRAYRELHRFPEKSVLRERNDGVTYLIYDLDHDCRLFLFMGYDYQKDGTAKIVGSPIFYKNKLSYRDFDTIHEGCSIKDVCKIDDLEELYERYFNYQISFYNFFEKCPEELREGGCRSIHYLTDGILVLYYNKLNEDGTLILTSKEYYPNYVMETCSGRKLDYTINPLDLP